jgi:streptomycin 6-kinase
LAIAIPERLAASCRRHPERRVWLDRLPQLVSALEARWRISLGDPLDGSEGSCSWVAPATRADGTAAIFKAAMPHFEGRDEIVGLRHWAGEPTVRLLEADDERNAMLLERCEPGTDLRQAPELEQDVVIASMLQRMWRRPVPAGAFRPLSEMIGYWIKETRAQARRWPDRGQVEEGLDIFAALAVTARDDVLLATDLHAGNVLRSQREPWLVIDPKPFIGDPAYDATQHLLNCRERLRHDSTGTIRRVADLLEVPADRVRLWLVARLTAEPREEWDAESMALAGRLS